MFRQRWHDARLQLVARQANISTRQARRWRDQADPRWADALNAALGAALPALAAQLAVEAARIFADPAKARPLAELLTKLEACRADLFAAAACLQAQPQIFPMLPPAAQRRAGKTLAAAEAQVTRVLEQLGAAPTFRACRPTTS